MITDVNSEDRLVQETFANYLHMKLGWESICKFNDETFGPNGTLGRANEREAVWVRDLRAVACGIVPVCVGEDPAELAKTQERIVYLKKNRVLAGPNWIAGLKCAVSLKGIGLGKPVSPLQPLTNMERQNAQRFHLDHH